MKRARLAEIEKRLQSLCNSMLEDMETEMAENWTDSGWNSEIAERRYMALESCRNAIMDILKEI